MFRNLLICTFFTIFYGSSYSQAILQGTLIDPLSGDPLYNVSVRSQFPDETSTDAEGKFVIKHANDQKVSLVFESNGQLIEWNSEIVANGTIDLGTITVQMVNTNLNVDLPTITLDEEDDEESANISGLLRTGDDLFGSIAD